MKARPETLWYKSKPSVTHSLIELSGGQLPPRQDHRSADGRTRVVLSGPEANDAVTCKEIRKHQRSELLKFLHACSSKKKPPTPYFTQLEISEGETIMDGDRCPAPESAIPQK